MTIEKQEECLITIGHRFAPNNILSIKSNKANVEIVMGRRVPGFPGGYITKDDAKAIIKCLEYFINDD